MGAVAKVFFYGLFMDRRRLEEKGFSPAVIDNAVLPDYQLLIRDRATLRRSKGERCYGVLMAMNESDLLELYSEPSVSDYRPVRVTVELSDGRQEEASSYNLPASMLAGETNRAYAEQLSELLTELDFPREYIRYVENYA